MKIDSNDTLNAPFIIAELSANHCQSLEIALKTISAAKRAGANAIKLQTYTPASLTLDLDKEEFIIRGGLWGKQRLWDLYKRAMTPRSWHEKLFAKAKEEGLVCFSTPFCKDDLDFLEGFNPPAYKIASFEAIDPEFVEMVARKNKPTLVSCGILTKDEIKCVVDIFAKVCNKNLILLKCTSSYPASINELNLANIKSLQSFGVEVGLSDHSAGFLAPLMSVALGVRVIEKHFVLDKSIKSEDSAFSLDEAEFKNMCEYVRLGVSAMGDGEFAQVGRDFGRSLYANKDIKKGALITPGQIACVRPFAGLHPRFKESLIGSIAKRDLAYGQPFCEDDIK